MITGLRESTPTRFHFRMRKWIIKKLGGHILDDEEKALLMPLWIKRMAEMAKKKMYADWGSILENGFSVTYCGKETTNKNNHAKIKR